MTLNLMLTTRSAVYLSGDFRLTYPGGRWKDDPRAQKLVPVFKLGWSALVSFAGVAKTPRGLDVGDWIAEQLQDIEQDARFDELPKRLLSADAWLSKVGGNRSLAFSIVGFVGRRPMAMVISNYTDLNGHRYAPIKPQLKKFESRPKEPAVLPVGDTGAVLDDDRNELKKMLKEHRAPREIEAALANANAEAAARTTTISPACVTGHLLPTGSAEVTPHKVDVWGEYLPGFVQRAFAAEGIRGFKRKIGPDGKPLSPKWRGMTARVHSEGPRKQATIVLHSVGNIEAPPLTDGKPGKSQIFWKVAGENEPDRYTFQINWGEG